MRSTPAAPPSSADSADRRAAPGGVGVRWPGLFQPVGRLPLDTLAGGRFGTHGPGRRTSVASPPGLAARPAGVMPRAGAAPRPAKAPRPALGAPRPAPA